MGVIAVMERGRVCGWTSRSKRQQPKANQNNNPHRQGCADRQGTAQVQAANVGRWGAAWSQMNLRDHSA